MRTYLLCAALAGAVLFAGQAGATDLLVDDDLDRMTAAGDPVVIISEGVDSTVVYNEDTSFELFIPKDAQVGLRALTIQNVVGELQLLVNLNVLSAANNVHGTDQRNFSLQSWGSTLPDADTVKTVDGVSASANGACAVAGSCASAAGTAGAGGAAAAAAEAAAATGASGGSGASSGAGGSGASSGLSIPVGVAVGSPTGGTGGTGGSNCDNSANCTGGSAGGALGPVAAAQGGGTGNGGNGGNTGNGGNGGNGGNAAAAAAAAAGDGGNGGSANAAGNSGIIKGNAAASTSPGVISDKIGSASGDVIILSKATTGNSQVAFDNAGRYSLNFESMAQQQLSALFVSNVVGRAQMALNLNIAAASLNLIPGSGDPFASPIGSTGDGIIKQVNTGLQFRGTPLVGASGTSGTFNTSITHLNQ